MSTDVYKRISSQNVNELESGARPRPSPWNAASTKERTTHPLGGINWAVVKGVSDAAA